MSSALSDLVHIKDEDRTALQNAVIAYDHRPQEAAEELATLTAELERLKAKDLDSRRCMYCGARVPDTDEAMLDHIFSCEKRPEKTLLKKAFEIEDRLYGWLQHLSESDSDCATCAEIEEALKIYNEKDEGANGHAD